MTIRTSVESARGCGYRKAGGYYLVAPALSEPCPRLPLELDRCPHCGQGIGPARGFTWITPAVLFPFRLHGGRDHDNHCPLGGMPPFYVNVIEGGQYVRKEVQHRTGERAGLIWVGGLYYQTPESFLDEATQMGVSRRIQKPPRGFKIGEHWIYLGHAKAIEVDRTAGEATPCPKCGAIGWVFPCSECKYDGKRPGVITLFRPTAIEYIVKGDETDEEIEALEKRGISPVKVIRDIDQ